MTRQRMNPRPEIRVRPMTPKRWLDLVELFGSRGACGGCWCMYWRRPRGEYTRGKSGGNRRSLKRLVDCGAPIGVLAYAGKKAIGWCAVAPRTEFVTLSRSRVLQPVDELPVWSVTCFFVAKAFRGRGVTVSLLEGAARLARLSGARILEGYPIDPRKGRQADVFVYTGLKSAFDAAGFTEVARRSPTRPIMRRLLRGAAG